MGNIHLQLLEMLEQHNQDKKAQTEPKLLMGKSLWEQIKADPEAFRKAYVEDVKQIAKDNDLI